MPARKQQMLASLAEKQLKIVGRGRPIPKQQKLASLAKDR